MATLTDIIIKVRRLTRSPSPNQISDTDITNYVNNFLLYDMPEHLRLFAMRSVFSWTCQPNIGEYATDATASVVALLNFSQLYITTHQPIYIAGRPAYYSEDRGEFFGRYPFVQQQTTIGMGDGITTGFIYTLTTQPILQNNVLISSVDINNNALSATDTPVNTVMGNLFDATTGNQLGTVNYITGAIAIDWDIPPMQGTSVVALTVPYVAQIPSAMLYFDDTFVLRPVPDKPYTINFEVYTRPIALNGALATPQLEQWWQYIAYGAAKKVFEERSDLDSVAQIMPEFKMQENLVNRRTIVQQTSRRVNTIYANQIEYLVPPWGPGDYTF